MYKNEKEYFKSDAKYLKLPLQFDYRGILTEAIKLKDKFVTHRDGSYAHSGWKSLCLHGLSETSTNGWSHYGYKNAYEAGLDSKWTSIADECPITMDFITNHFPSNRFARVRFMLLEAGGHIGEHVDSRVPLLENINLSLSNPEGCIWHWGDGETMFMEPGSAYAVNIHYPHSVINNSNEDRYHLIIHRHDSTNEWKSMIESACKEQGVTGEFFKHTIEI